jgi:uncharacterized protein
MRYNVAQLLKEPIGSTRSYQLEETFTGSERFANCVNGSVHFLRTHQGILVNAELEAQVTLACGRCLAVQRRHLDVDVAELFVDPARQEDGEEDDPGYELIDDLTALDLSTLARDALLIDLPVRVLCRDDCLGLCPTCGADRNQVDCGHQAGDDPDPRWSRLLDLDLPAE